MSAKKKSLPAPEAAEESPAQGVEVREGDFEEVLLEFWRRRRRVIEGAAVLLFVVVLAYQIMIYVADRKEAAVRLAYQEAEEGESLIGFAEEYSRHPLSGFAYLEVANREYGEREFEAAAGHYLSAVETLEETPLAGRARLGFAMARIQSGHEDEGRSALLEIANDTEGLDGTRAEAAYNLAVLYWEREEFSEMKGQLDLIAKLEFPGLRKPPYWISKADQLMNSLPELRDLAD